MCSKIKYVIGTQPHVQWALFAWQEVEPDTEYCLVEINQDSGYRFDLKKLDDLPRGQCTAFVAQNAQFLNFRRYELMAELKARGFSMPPLIEKGAIIASTAKVSENSWIGAGAILGQACTIGFNTVIGSGANIGHGAKVGNSVWIEAGVLVGPNARIGTHTTLGQGIIVAAGVDVEKQVILEKPGKITDNVLGGTFTHENFDEPIVIVNVKSA